MDCPPQGVHLNLQACQVPGTSAYIVDVVFVAQYIVFGTNADKRIFPPDVGEASTQAATFTAGEQA